MLRVYDSRKRSKEEFMKLTKTLQKFDIPHEAVFVNDTITIGDVGIKFSSNEQSWNLRGLYFNKVYIDENVDDETKSYLILRERNDD